ncbi:MAG: glutathione-dependent reductase [Rhizobiaceae bacterium]|nr:glutathione-dependent reductase [Rhizobiaceae bacterium]
MGMLQNGRWIHQDTIIKNGTYLRAASPIRAENPAAIAARMSKNPKSFLLIASHSCPWSHRTVLLHAIRRMAVPVHYAHGPRVEGYAANGGEVWQVPGRPSYITHLHQLYTLHNPAYSGRSTVPLLWDSTEQRIVSNESSDILKILDLVGGHHIPQVTMRPPSLRAKIEAANQMIYHGLNNAVYQAGFAEQQDAYDQAVTLVFETLDCINQHLAVNRFYFGPVITETDLWIFPSLVRFDAVYAVLFKCSKRRLADYSHLWEYARDLFAVDCVRNSIDFEQMRRGCYLADGRDPNPIIAIAPDNDWFAPHLRHKLGPTQLALRCGGFIDVDHSTLSQISNG